MRQPLNREVISAAARDILVSDGLHGVSLRRVATNLGVTAPALYAHVADKRDLLQGIVEQEVDRLIERFETVQGGDPLEHLRGMCRAYVDYGLTNPDLFRAMFLFRPELTAEPWGGKPALGERIHRAFVAAVERAQHDHVIEGIDAELAALTVWTTAHGVVTTLLSGPPLHIDLKNRLADTAVVAALTGLRHGALTPAA